MGKSWSLDLSMIEKVRIVQAKATLCGISDSEAHKLCVVEYETGIPQNTVTQQAINTYNMYKTEAPRPGTPEHTIWIAKLKRELRTSHIEARERAKMLEEAAKKTVEERMIAKHGVETTEKAFRSLDKYEAEKGFFGLGLKLPDLSIGDAFGDVKRGGQITGIVLMAFVALIIYVIFVKGRGAEGVTVVGK